MRYFVIHPGGQRYGPADLPTLNQWAAEGRLNAQTLLAEEATQRQVPANQVPGLVFPVQGSAYGPGNPYSTVTQTTPYSSAYGGAPLPQNYGTSEGASYLNASYILGVLGIALNLFCICSSLWMLGLILGVIGVVLALIGKSKGTPATAGIVLGVAAILLSIGIAVLLQVMQSGPRPI